MVVIEERPKVNPECLRGEYVLNTLNVVYQIVGGVEEKASDNAVPLASLGSINLEEPTSRIGKISTNWKIGRVHIREPNGSELIVGANIIRSL